MSERPVTSSTKGDRESLIGGRRRSALSRRDFFAVRQVLAGADFRLAAACFRDGSGNGEDFLNTLAFLGSDSSFLVARRSRAICSFSWPLFDAGTRSRLGYISREQDVNRPLLSLFIPPVLAGTVRQYAFADPTLFINRRATFFFLLF